MRGSLKLLMAGVLAAGILACTPAAQQSGAGNDQASSQEPRYGGVLHYASAGIAANVHPYGSGASGTAVVVAPVYEPLLKAYKLAEATDATPEYAVGPWLAEGWTNPNPTTYVFKIRQGVKWQDGRDFTAEDVVFTWDYLVKNKTQVAGASIMNGVQSFRTIDAYTVELVSKQVDADFLKTVTSSGSYGPPIIAKHVVESGADITKVSMGTGPFKLKDFSTARGVVHVRNENYWNKGLPYLDGIIGYYNMDRSAMIAAMTVGQLDLFNPENDPQFEAVKSATSNLQYASYAQAYNYSLMPKLTQPPFDGLKVRQAMNLAIDRQALSATLSGGKGSINPPGVLGWMTDFALPQEELLKMSGFNPATKQQDIAQAKKLLAEAGYPNGFKSTLIYQGQFSGPPPIAEMVSTQLKAVGIDLTLKPAENNLYDDTVTLKGIFEVKLERGSDANFSNQLFIKYHSKGVQNKQGLADPVLDELIEKQAVTLDAKARQKIVQDIQRRILDNVYVIPTIDTLSYTTWQPWVHNYGYSRNAQTSYLSYTPFNMWFDTSMMPEGRLKEDAAAIK